MQRNKKPTLPSKSTKLPFSTTKKSTKSPSKPIKSNAPVKEDLQPQIASLELRLQQEKSDYISLQSQLSFAQSSAAEKGGLRMKRLREENEDLTERLEVEEAKRGALELQLRDEKALRQQRDGTTGFLRIFKNDPEIWMAGKVGTMSGGGGGGKRKREEERDNGMQMGEVAREDLLARKKRENEMWVSQRRREGLVNEDDEEVEFDEAMRIKLEERKIEKEKKETEDLVAGPKTGLTGAQDSEIVDREYALRFAEWLAAKPEKRIGTSSAIINNLDAEAMDCDELFFT